MLSSSCGGGGGGGGVVCLAVVARLARNGRMFRVFFAVCFFTRDTLDPSEKLGEIICIVLSMEFRLSFHGSDYPQRE